LGRFSAQSAGGVKPGPAGPGEAVKGAGQGASRRRNCSPRRSLQRRVRRHRTLRALFRGLESTGPRSNGVRETLQARGAGLDRKTPTSTPTRARSARTTPVPSGKGRAREIQAPPGGAKNRRGLRLLQRVVAIMAAGGVIRERSARHCFNVVTSLTKFCDSAWLRTFSFPGPFLFNSSSRKRFIRLRFALARWPAEQRAAWPAGRTSPSGARSSGRPGRPRSAAR